MEDQHEPAWVALIEYGAVRGVTLYVPEDCVREAREALDLEDEP